MLTLKVGKELPKVGQLISEANAIVPKVNFESLIKLDISKVEYHVTAVHVLFEVLFFYPGQQSSSSPSSSRTNPAIELKSDGVLP